MVIDEAAAYLRRQTGQVETIYYAYVLDEDQRLQGFVSIRDLLSGRRDQPVRNLMRTRFQSVQEQDTGARWRLRKAPTRSKWPQERACKQ